MEKLFDPNKKIEQLVNKRYLYVQAREKVEIKISKVDVKNFMVTMENIETGSKQEISYDNFLALLKSEALKSL